MLGPKLTFFLFSIYYLVTSVLILFGPQLIFIGSLSLANLLDIRRLRLPSNKSHLLWVPSCIRRAQIPFIMGPVLSKAGIFFVENNLTNQKKSPERLFLKISVVSREGLEPSTPGLKGPCSNLLSYRPREYSLIICLPSQKIKQNMV